MISVCIATYNGERYIEQQLSSILKQLSDNDEVIVSDDGSMDRTIDLIKSLRDKRIKIIKHKRNFIRKWHPNGYYCSNNFSNALENAVGDYIFLSDQDDIWYDNKVENMIHELKTYDICISNFSIIDQNNKVIMEKYFHKNPITNNWFMNLNKNVYFGCCMAFRKEVKDLCVPIPKSIVSYDSWIGTISLLEHKTVKFLETPLLYYRRHGNNISAATGKSKNSLIFKIYWRLEFLKTIFMKDR